MDIFAKEAGISREELEMLGHIGALSVREYDRKRVLLGGDDEGDLTGVLLFGTAFLESINLENQRRILDFYRTRDTFCRRFFPEREGRLYYVVSAGRCRVLFVHEDRLPPEGAGERVRSLLRDTVAAGVVRRGLNHVDILEQRTLRQKLLTLFSDLGHSPGRVFVLPFSLTDCADYLAVDRSSMMRELKKMKEEGLVELQGRKVRVRG